MSEPQYYQKEIRLLEDLWLNENDYTSQQREDMYMKLDEYRNDLDYECFLSVEDLIEDHKKLKESIKERELKLDVIVLKLLQKIGEEDIKDIEEELDEMSGQMMSVNM